MRLRNILFLLVILFVLGGYFYFSNIPVLEEREPQTFIWLIELEEIQRVEIRLPGEDMSQAFVRAEDRSWHFDDPQKSKVDMERWGGGIPLLLSGPEAKRVIARNATQEKLTEFGLTQPQMDIILTLEDEDILNITLGNRTPDGNAFYVKAPGSNDVALVDYLWYEVIERLVKQPPYAPLEED